MTLILPGFASLCHKLLDSHVNCLVYYAMVLVIMIVTDYGDVAFHEGGCFSGDAGVDSLRDVGVSFVLFDGVEDVFVHF